jgi:hypothetical protein
VSNDSYNRYIITLNKKLISEKLDSAEKSIKQMQKNTIFNDFEVESRLKLIIIKSGYTSNNRKIVNYTQSSNTNDVITNSLLIDRIYSSVLAQNLIKYAIIENATSDSLIYVFELLKSNTSKISLRPNKFNKATLNLQLDKSEALQLLDIMKKNEKLIL